MTVEQRGNAVFLPISRSELDIAITLDCGQCFRFTGDGGTGMRGIARGRYLHAVQTEDGILFHNTDLKTFEAVWANYFDLGTDYEAMKRLFSSDETLRAALSRTSGIRILRQEPFEALLSFLISQNNNIPRIKACIERLCTAFGEPLPNGEGFAFPTPQRIASLEKEDLKGIGLGYRDTYLLDCARRVCDGRLDLAAVGRMGLDEARESLRTVTGIGPKVAECALLFGFHRLEAFPVDTWMRKVLSRYYPGGFPEKFAPEAGVAQQYLFHAMREQGELSAS